MSVSILIRDVSNVRDTGYFGEVPGGEVNGHIKSNMGNLCQNIRNLKIFGRNCLILHKVFSLKTNLRKISIKNANSHKKVNGNS